MANENEDQEKSVDSEIKKRREAASASSDDGDDETKEGDKQYESHREPGDKVRVARMTENLDSPAQKEADDQEDGEEDDEVQEGSFGVTVRGEGEVQQKAEPDEQADEESDTSEASDKAGGDPEAGSSGGPAADSQETSGGDASAPSEQLSEDELREAAAREAGERVEASQDDLSMDDAELDKQLGAGGEEATTEEFAELLGGTGENLPQQREYSPGDRVEGDVLAVGEYNIFVQLDPQSEGIAKRREFTDEEGNLELQEGDTAEFYVLETTEDEIFLGEQLGGNEGSIEAVREAHDSGVPVKGKVTGTNKGGFEVEVHGVDAFCPISQIELGYTEEKEQHIGATYRFKISEVRDGGDTVVVSRRELLEEEREAAAQETLEKLEEGMVVKGVVSRTTEFGAFIDLGGVEGLAHISELSHGHLNHPDDVVSEGEEIEVEVLEIEEGDGDDDLRIGLSKKATVQDPWEVVNEQFGVGDTVEGTVSRNAPFGSFVEIAPGVEGLVHVSEMSWTEHVRTPDEVVEPGDTVTVEVQDIDLSKNQIGLSMKAAEGNPWETVEDDFAEGMQVEGTVENIEDFGAFVKLSTGITALIPRSEMSLPEGVTPHRKLSEGESVEARVLNIDPDERKMALTTKRDEDEAAAADTGDRSSQSRDDDSQSSSSESPSGNQTSGSFGTLGDLIGDDLEDQ